MKLRDNKWINFLRTRLSIGKVGLFLFVIFIVFVDENSCIKRAKYDKEINRLNQLIQAQNDTTEHYTRLVEELTNDPQLVEQVAREKFYMCRPNEHIYIIEDSPSQN